MENERLILILLESGRLIGVFFSQKELDIPWQSGIIQFYFIRSQKWHLLTGKTAVDVISPALILLKRIYFLEIEEN